MAHHRHPQPTTAQRQRQGGSLHVLSAAVLASLALLWVGLYTSLVHSQQRQTSLATQRQLVQSAHTHALARVLELWKDPGVNPWAQAGISACATHPLRAQMDLRWECMRVTAAEHSEGQAVTLEVIAARDVHQAPQLAHISIRSQPADGQSRLHERASLWTSDWGTPPSSNAPVPDPALAAQLVLQGCQEQDGTLPGFSVYSLAIPDLDGDGLLSAEERIRCLAKDLLYAPASGTERLSGEIGAQVSPGACIDQVWPRLFGSITPVQVQRLSQAQARAGLSQSTQPKRSMYWVDERVDWTQDLGDPEQPVVLVFSEAACQAGCPSIRSRIFGTVYFATQCQAARLHSWQLGRIQGLVGVASGLSRWPGTGGLDGFSQRENALNFSSLPLTEPSSARLVPGSRHWP